MERVKVHIALMSWLLSFVAGYADTSTFITANRLFSAHVTGNLVVLVFNVLTKPDPSIWLNLLAFPVFITGVVISSLIVAKSRYPGRVLRLEGVLLLVAGILALIVRYTGMENAPIRLFLALITVAAMGLQNGFGKLYPYTTYSVTTMMTGNVTQLTLNIMQRILTKMTSLELRQNLQKQALIIGSFFLGCIVGGTISHFIGLSGMIFPGLLVLYFWIRRKELILVDGNREGMDQPIPGGTVISKEMQQV